MKILGLDPGSLHTGYGLVERRGSRIAPLLAGRLSPPRGMPLVERLGRIAQGLGEIVDTHAPDLAALESPFYHRNPRSLIALAQARGAILAILALRGLVVEEYSPAEVKSAITGSGRADKGQVARMVALTLSLGDEKLPADATDALAVAICCAQRLRMDRFRGPGRGGGREG